MPEEIRLGASGLWTDPSELQAPPGALREALNVRIRRPNVIEPRPGFPYVAQAGLTGQITLMKEYAGGLLCVSGGELWHVTSGGVNTEVTDPDGASLSITTAECSIELAADVAMVTTDNGVFFINEDLSTYRAISKPATPSVRDATGSGVANTEFAAIRVVFARKLDSGRYLFSPPSDRVVYENDSGSAKGIQVTAATVDGVVAGDILQVYGTDVASSAVGTGDEMTLAAHRIVTSSDITSGYAQTTAYVNDTPQGAALYTNETQEGILQSNDPPQKANRLAWYSQMAFYGDLDAMYQYEYVAEPDDGTNTLTAATVNASYTNGSPVVSLTSGTVATNWVGTYLSDSGGTVDPAVNGGTVPAYTKIISVDTGANTFTMSNNALQTALDASTAYPSLTVGDIDYIYYAGSSQSVERRTWSDEDDLVQVISFQDGWFAEFRFEGTIYGTDDTDVNGELFIGNAAAFDVELFSTSLSDSLLGIIDVGTTYSATAARRNSSRLMWSKTLQPESVPAVHYIDIGSSDEPILGLEATRDSLFVLKGDGVWRVTGSDPDTLRIDEFDRTIELIHPRAVTTLRNDIWAWTTNGIVRLNEGGSQSMSDTAIRNVIEANQDQVYEQAQAGTYVGGCFMGSSETDGIVVVGVPPTDATSVSEVSDYVYVFEARTNAWVRWQHANQETTTDQVWLSFASFEGKMTFGGGGGGLMTESSENYDFEVAITVAGAGSNVVGPDGVTYPGSCDDIGPALKGYRIERDAKPWILFEQTGSEDHILSTGITNGGGNLWTPYECRVEWVALTAGNPAQLAHWRDVHVMLGDASALPGMELSFSTERVPTEGAIEVRTFLDPLRPEPVALRGRVTRAHARAKRLRLTLSSFWAGQSWLLEGVAITVQPQRGGERTP